MASPSTLLTKVVNRAKWAYSSGSPLLYLRKGKAIVQKPGSFIARRKQLKRLLPTPTSEQQSRLEELRKTGFAMTPDLRQEELYQQLQAATAQKLAGGINQHPERSYFSTLLTQEDLQPHSIFVRYAMQQKVLASVATFFGEVPSLFSLEIIVSQPTVEGKWSESQLWHRDHDDSKILKLFVYLSDVSSEDRGPFTFIPAPASATIPNTVIPQRITDEQMARRGGTLHQRSVIGPEGTHFFIDTARCYHMGSRCKSTPRVAYIATYTTYAPLDLIPRRFTPTPGAQYSDLEKMVLFP